MKPSFLSWPSSTLVPLFLVFFIDTNHASAPAVKSMDPQLQEEYCKNFTYGNPVAHEFFSPGFPHNYPAGIKCFRTISADYGYFVRVDFRDFFRIEPPSNEGRCDYDYLEVGPVVVRVTGHVLEKDECKKCEEKSNANLKKQRML